MLFYQRTDQIIRWALALFVLCLFVGCMPPGPGGCVCGNCGKYEIDSEKYNILDGKVKKCPEIKGMVSEALDDGKIMKYEYDRIIEAAEEIQEEKSLSKIRNEFISKHDLDVE